MLCGKYEKEVENLTYHTTFQNTLVLNQPTSTEHWLFNESKLQINVSYNNRIIEELC